MWTLAIPASASTPRIMGCSYRKSPAVLVECGFLSIPRNEKPERPDYQADWLGHRKRGSILRGGIKRPATFLAAFLFPFTL